MTASNAEIQRIVETATRSAVNETFIRLGIDVNDPIRAQGDFLAMREMSALFANDEFKADLMHLRKWRLSMESVQTKGIITTVGLVVTGLVALLLLGFRKYIGG